MPSRFTASSTGSQHIETTQPSDPSPKALSVLGITRHCFIFSLALFLIASCTTGTKSFVGPPRRAYIDNSTIPYNVEQHVQQRASLIQKNLPAYLQFVGRDVIPVMSRNIDELLHEIGGLTDIRPGFFYHGHLSYSTQVSGGIDALMDMNNVILQYHTLENPVIYIPYWREELSRIPEQNISVWLRRVNEFNQAISTPSAASAVHYTPLTESQANQIASTWDQYRRENGLASPGLEMLIQMVYLIDGGRQPLYRESYKIVNRFHSIAFLPEGFVQLDNRTHIANTFSPFQIIFAYAAECPALISIFEEARAAGFSYIVNPANGYAALHPELTHNRELLRWSIKLDRAIRALPDDNLIKMSHAVDGQQIAFFAAGNYVFALNGSLDLPSIFK